MVDLLQNPYQLSLSLVKIYTVYYDKLELTGFSGIEPFLHEIIMNNLKYIPSVEKQIKKSIKYLGTGKFDEIFNYYYLIENVVSKVTQIYEIFKQHSISISEEGSYTSSGTTLTRKYISDLTSLLAQIDDVITILRKELVQNDIVDYLTQLLYDPDLKSVVDHISDIYTSYYQKEEGHLVIKLYSYALQHFINLSKNKDTINHILELVEIIKTQVLLGDQVKRIPAKNSIQRLLQWYSLVPMQPSQDLSQLMKLLGVEIEATWKDLPKKLLEIAKLLSTNEKKIGFLVISKIISHPIEHNFWVLTDKNYLEQNQIFQSTSAGVSDKAIARSKTLKTLEPIISEDNIIFVDETFELQTKNYYYVLDTLDGKNFRFLCNTFGSDNIFPIAESVLSNIKKELYPSRRISTYNSILNREIIRHIDKPFIKTTLVNHREIQQEEIKLKNIRSDIIKRSSKKFSKLITVGDFENLKKIFLQMNEHIINIITEMVALETLTETANPLQNLKKYYYAELTISYLYDLKKLTANINRSMESEIQENTDKIKKAIEYKNELITIFEHILETVLTRWITRQSNIYQTVQEKSDIVIHTLL